MRNAISFTVLILIPFVFTGCGEKLRGLSGTVTYDGRPVPSGIITFTPDADRGNLIGRSTITAIKDGRFDLPANDGFSGGWYLMEIVSTKSEEGDVDDEGTRREVYNFPPYTTSHEFKPDVLTLDIAIPKK